MQKLDFILIMIDTGDTAWMLIAGCLVLLMIPALGLFESGLLRKKIQFQFSCKYFSECHYLV